MLRTILRWKIYLIHQYRILGAKNILSRMIAKKMLKKYSKWMQNYYSFKKYMKIKVDNIIKR